MSSNNPKKRTRIIPFRKKNIKYSNPEINQRATNIIIGTLLLFLAAIIILYVATIDKPIGDAYKPVYEYGGDFTLQTLEKDITLEDYRGKVVVAYFGFLSCTEACPVSMGTITKAISNLTPEERAQLQILFISVDPDRDSLKSLSQFSKHYAKRFKNETNPQMILAVTGTPEKIDEVSDQYGVYFDLVDLEGSALGYTVDHSSRFYMIGKDGKLVTTMNHSTTPVELAARIKQIQKDTSAKVKPE